MSDRLCTASTLAQFMLACACAIPLAWAGDCRAGVPASEVFKNVRIDQRVGDRVPADLAFTDDEGRPVQLGQYAVHRPAILALVYYNCPNLCPMLLRHLTQGLNGIALVAGRDFDVIVVSIDPADTVESAAHLKLSCIRAYGYQDTSDGWHFLIGAAAQVGQLEQAVGFHCIYDAQRKQYVHPLGAMVLAPGGVLSHYFYGVDFSPADLEAALKDAATGRSTRVDQPEQQYCLDYRPADSRYGRLAVHALQVLAAIWVLLLLAYIGRELIRERRGGIAGHRVSTGRGASRPISVGRR